MSPDLPGDASLHPPRAEQQLAGLCGPKPTRLARRAPCRALLGGGSGRGAALPSPGPGEKLMPPAQGGRGPSCRTRCQRPLCGSGSAGGCWGFPSELPPLPSRPGALQLRGRRYQRHGRARHGGAQLRHRQGMHRAVIPLGPLSVLVTAGNGTQPRRQGHFSRCPEEYQHYCVKGRCRFLVAEQAPACVCERGYTGARCERVDLFYLRGDQGQIVIISLIVAIAALIILVVGICLCSQVKAEGEGGASLPCPLLPLFCLFCWFL
ncbi:probetacellulin isoform X2 [Agelaius phoeniceus]|uniref:probetacellulin isoform X2 n=1 Tax=Agelaius phoeniceus TaxID=39638 RepID=UPI004054C13D